jgi:hypothetical protein
MADYPYTSNVGRFKMFLEKIRQSGVPEKVTRKVLESMGFKSKNDRSFIRILKFIGLLDPSGGTTELWQKFRNRKTGGAALGDALRRAYPELFTLYPDAHRKDSEALRDFFSSHTKLGEGAIKYMVDTFKTLADLCDIQAGGPVHPVLAGPKESVQLTRIDRGGGASININIELAIPATDDPKTYDLLFAAMRKYLIES